MWLVVTLMLLGAGTTPDSSGIHEIGKWPFGPSYTLAEDTSRNLIFLGSGAGVFILQPGNSGEFTVISDGIRTEGGAVTVLAYDYTHRVLFTGGDNSRLEAWDLSDPADPVRIFEYQDEVTNFFVDGWVSDIIIYGDHLFVSFCSTLNGNYTGSVKIFNLANLGQVAGSINIQTLIGNLFIENGRLYVQESPNFIRIYDISDVTNPVLITGFNDYGERVIVEDTLLYSVSGGMWGGAITIFNISDITNPVEISTTSLQISTVTRVRKYGTNLFICGDWLDAWDISDPNNVRRLWGFGVYGGNGIDDFSLDNGSYLAAAKIAGLSVIGFDSLGMPFEAMSFRTPGYAEAITVGNGNTYYLSWTNGSTTLDVLNGAELVGKVRVPVSSGAGLNAAYANGHVYFTTDSLLVSVDVTNPQDPEVDGVLDFQQRVMNRNLIVNGDYAYISEDSGIYVVRLDSMQVVSRLQDTSLMYGNKAFAMEGNYLYMSYGLKLAAFDISDPRNPILLSVIEFSQAYAIFRSIAISGDYGFISTEVNQIIIVDLTNPAYPVYDSVYFPPGNRGDGLYSLQFSGNYLLGTTGLNYSTVVAFDATNPLSLRIGAYYDNYYNLDNFVHFKVDGNTIYLADYSIGVHILNFNPLAVSEISDERSTIQIFPDRLRFSLEADGFVNLRIYDVSGRLVKHWKRFFRSGEHDVKLTGMRSGIYFFTIDAGRLRYSGKTMVIK